MTIYLVENEDAPINNWGCYWLVKASSAKEAIDRVYSDENSVYNKDLAKAARETGILKRKLTATKVDDRLFDGGRSYMIQ